MTLTVDHVLPTALGGSDEPGNLVTACKDCNAGKAASNPDQPIVDQVSEDAMRWAEAVKAAACQANLEFESRLNDRNTFLKNWHTWELINKNGDRDYFPLPNGWVNSIDCLRSRGLTDDLIRECVCIAMRNGLVSSKEKFRYFCGAAWKKIKEIDEMAKIIYDREAIGSDNNVCTHAHSEVPLMEIVDSIVTLIVKALTDKSRARWVANHALWSGAASGFNEYRRLIPEGKSPTEDERDAALQSATKEIHNDIDHLIETIHRQSTIAVISAESDQEVMLAYERGEL